jgi:hypothetical protein
MKVFLLGATLLACWGFGLTGCGGDDDDDGAGACANAEKVCANDTDAMIECSDLDGVPASIADCVSKAASCDAVLNCLIAGSAGSGGG